MNFQSMLDGEGVDAQVRQEIGALTASAEGDIAHILVIFTEQTGSDIWAAVCAALVILAGKKGVNKFNEIRARDTVRMSDGETGADITDVPTHALEALADPPPAPSSELEWRVERQSWADAFDQEP